MKNLLIMSLVCTLFCSGTSQTSFQTEVHGLNLKLVASSKDKVAGKNFGEDERVESEYIGFLIDKDGNDFFVVNTIHITNKKRSPTHTNFIMIYDAKKNFVGHYYLSFSDQLPNEIRGNQMIFTKICEAENLQISFSKGVARAINLGCKGSPDFYEFIMAE